MKTSEPINLRSDQFLFQIEDDFLSFSQKMSKQSQIQSVKILPEKKEPRNIFSPFTQPEHDRSFLS